MLVGLQSWNYRGLVYLYARWGASVACFLLGANLIIESVVNNCNRIGTANTVFSYAISGMLALVQLL